MVNLMNEDRLRAIFPSLSDKELKEAAENLGAYFAFALQTAIKSRGEVVDKVCEPDTMKERSSRSLKNTTFEHG